MVHPYNIFKIKYYSVIKRNKLVTHKKDRDKPTCTLLEERNQYKNLTYCIILIILYSGRSKIIERVNKSVFDSILAELQGVEG